MSAPVNAISADYDQLDLPRIISVDDHVVEPKDLWSARLPASRRDVGPRVIRARGVLRMSPHGGARSIEDPDHPDARDTDVWVYEDMYFPLTVGFANVGPARDAGRDSFELMTYDEMLPGCYDQAARLRDMDANHTDASICFPTVPRFCGQTFLERSDKQLALECVRIYNDWMTDEWCGGLGRGHLIPLTLIPLWDPQLAADEVRRCAAKGSHAVCFPEAMQPLGLPTLYSGEWEQFLRVCDETQTVVNMHIGSSSKMPGTSSDAPPEATTALLHENAAHALVDWVLSGVLVEHPGVRIALSEAQAGWLPFMTERLDDLWERAHMYPTGLQDRLPDPPSLLIRNRVYTCIFNDTVGLRARDHIGMNHLMFETDYPHSDSTFPNSKAVAAQMIKAADLDADEAYRFLRGNAIECYGLGRFGITG
jgi:predicted TIM-barrel fold metal-dependent hydrolase